MEPFDAMWVLIHSLLFAAVAAFILTIFSKTGLTAWYQTYRPRWMPHDCTFCFGWWAGGIICGLWWLLVDREPHLLACLPIIPIFLIHLLKQR